MIMIYSVFTILLFHYVCYFVGTGHLLVLIKKNIENDKFYSRATLIACKIKYLYKKTCLSTPLYRSIFL